MLWMFDLSPLRWQVRRFEHHACLNGPEADVEAFRLRRTAVRNVSVGGGGGFGLSLV